MTNPSGGNTQASETDRFFARMWGKRQDYTSAVETYGVRSGLVVDDDDGWLLTPAGEAAIKRVKGEG